MTRQMRLNAFAMDAVGHVSPGLWTHPRDRSTDYNSLAHWTGLARLLDAAPPSLRLAHVAN